MHEARRSRRRGLMMMLALVLGWLVVQNTALLAVLVWMQSHSSFPALANLLRVGSVVVAASVTVASAMIVGAAVAMAVVRGRRSSRMGRMEVRHV